MNGFLFSCALDNTGFRLDERLERHFDEEQPVFHPQRILGQMLISIFRGAGDRLSIWSERTIMARTKKPLVVRLPMDTTAEMGTSA